MEPKQRIKAMCVFVQNGKTLASKGYDKYRDETFYRLIGGSVEFQETGEDGIKREIREELKTEIEDLKLIEITENIYFYLGKPYHDIIFLYKGELANKDLYKQEKIRIIEPYLEFDAEWISIDDILLGKKILYPKLDYSKVLI